MTFQAIRLIEAAPHLHLFPKLTNVCWRYFLLTGDHFPSAFLHAHGLVSKYMQIIGSMSRDLLMRENACEESQNYSFNMLSISVSTS